MLGKRDYSESYKRVSGARHKDMVAKQRKRDYAGGISA